MLQRSAHLSWFNHRGALFLYHDLTGYVVEMSPDLRAVTDAFADSADDDLVREKLGASIGRHIVDQAIDVFATHQILVPPDTDELAQLHNMVPVKARWIVVDHNGDGLTAWLGRNLQTPATAHRFSTEEARIWRSIDGEKSSEELAVGLGLDIQKTARVLAQWAHSENQLVRVHAVPLSFYRGRNPPAWLASTMPWPRDGEPGNGSAGSQPSTRTHAMLDLAEYHSDGITDADAQFDEIETTLSHLFRVPHEALQGQTFAEATLSSLLDLDLVDETTEVVAEVGGGLAFFASGLLDALQAVEPGVYDALSYTVYDLSPELQRAQRKRLARHSVAHTVLSDGQELADVPDESVDLIVSNEVIADFQTAVLRRTDDGGEDDGWEDPDAMLARLEEDEEPADERVDWQGPEPALEAIDRYELALYDAPDPLLFNLGAVRFLETAWRVLKPGGGAWITEFGDLWRYPVESTHLDHAEVSIHFGQLRHVARRLGFEADVLELFDVLGFDGDVETLASTRTWFRNLRALAASHQIDLPKIAWTRSMLEEACGDALDPDDVETLRWQSVEERVMGLCPREFKVLVLRKPA